MRATGRLHLGNYFGAAKGMLELQDNDSFETLYMVADVHALTTPYQVKELQVNREEVFLDYLSAGLDPEKSVIFLQSMVPQHLELAFYFSSVATIARMQHLPTFKDTVKQYPEHATMALLNYPILMAADILVYQAGAVPVGIDQEPHLEISREIARKMNTLYGTTFPEPERFVTKGEYIPSLRGQGKMSKSVAGSYVSITDTPDEVKKKIRSVPTATEASGEISGGIKTLFTLLELMAPNEVDLFKNQYQNGGLRFVELKDAVTEAINQELQPLQAKRNVLLQDPGYIQTVMERGAEQARDIAQQTVDDVKQKMGLKK